MQKVGACADADGNITDLYTDGEKYYRENPCGAKSNPLTFIETYRDIGTIDYDPEFVGRNPYQAEVLYDGGRSNLGNFASVEQARAEIDQYIDVQIPKYEAYDYNPPRIVARVDATKRVAKKIKGWTESRQAYIHLTHAERKARKAGATDLAKKINQLRKSMWDYHLTKGPDWKKMPKWL